MNQPSSGDDKLAALRLHHALNPRAQAVSDSAFTSGHPFFDARDLVQVKYEMLRRARQEGQSVSQAAAAFGFSRPSFYAARALFEQAGLPGLVPQRPGPRRAHKLSEAVVDFLEERLAEESSVRSSQLAQLLEDRFSISVHPRSVERALGRRRKRGVGRQKVDRGSGGSLVDVVQAVEDRPGEHVSIGLARAWHRSLQPERSVGPILVVVADELC